MNTVKTLTCLLTATVAVSLMKVSPAKADIDPALCGLGGAVVGGVIGNQFGGGSGKDALTVIGAIAGAVGGVQFCKPVQSSQDVTNARNYERRALDQGGPVEWSNPQYGRGMNSRSHVEKRGWHGSRECTMTRSVMSDQYGRYMNETVWCLDRGQWVAVTETTTISQIQWGARGPVQTTTTTTTRPGVPMAPPVVMPPRAEQLPYWIVSENRAANLAREIDRAFDSDRVRIASDYARDFSRAQQFLTLDQLGSVLRAARFDSTRNQILRVLVAVVDQRYGSTANALSTFDHGSSRDEARRVLDGRRGDGRRDGGRREDPRRDDHRRHDGPVGRFR